MLLQQEIGKSKNVVMDGRDIGTKVFPDARLKACLLLQVLKLEHKEGMMSWRKKKKITYEEVLHNLAERDDHDTNREINPLIQAKDAILIDNSDLSIQKQNDLIDNLIKLK